ncbi:MAG: UDP-N-acetylmuramoyl-tripeptide--D-alanyl-D-alanine ligase [Lachnospiraceae bacterium]|nr:UDP-N-acetylmuramoyl-tripeptide--D-alanyl-D-alanine ligase [Lachnospiraceae bacterium]
MKNVRAKDIVEAVGGRLLCGDPETLIENISIDSRTMKGRDLFVPIRGAKVDAHRFIPGAFAAGAAATFTSEDEEKEDTHPWIRVDDTVRALQALGAWYRERLTMPIVGITGSVGKTTTREMITAALSAGKRVYSTHGNSNGQLGVPLTISEADLSAEVAVLEMGMSEPGEMPRIAAIARPQIAVVTNIGVSHIENLGSRENICREKLHITDFFEPDNVLIFNGDDDLLPAWRDNGRFRTVSFGQGPENEYRAEDIHQEGGRTCFTVRAGERSLALSLGVPGLHNVMNALAALATADQCGVDMAAAAEKLAEFHGFDRRLQVFGEGGYTYIDDTYNASPDSMRAALQVLAETPAAGRRIAVLADMLELGPDAPEYHRQIGAYAAKLPVDRVFLVGDLAKNIGRGLEEAGRTAVYCENNREAAEQIRVCRRPGDVILLKGSNGMHLGEVLAALRDGKAEQN